MHGFYIMVSNYHVQDKVYKKRLLADPGTPMSPPGMVPGMRKCRITPHWGCFFKPWLFSYHILTFTPVSRAPTDRRPERVGCHVALAECGATAAGTRGRASGMQSASRAPPPATLSPRAPGLGPRMLNTSRVSC